MYAISLSSGLLLFEKYAMAVAVSVVGVILGWPFSILAFLPVVIYSLVKRFKQAFISGAVTSILLLVSQTPNPRCFLCVGFMGNIACLLFFHSITSFASFPGSLSTCGLLLLQEMDIFGFESLDI